MKYIHKKTKKIYNEDEIIFEKCGQFDDSVSVYKKMPMIPDNSLVPDYHHFLIMFYSHSYLFWEDYDLLNNDKEYYVQLSLF
jgi:hypothetical protein